MKQGDLLFHVPDEFHSPQSNGKTAPNIFIVTFECTSPAMSFFHTRNLFHTNDEQRALLKQIMKESFNSFAPEPKGGGARLSPREEAPFGSEQMFVIYLEILLIQLIREGNSQSDVGLVLSPVSNAKSASQLEQIMAYMTKHIADNFTLEQLCSHFGIGRTQISILFKNQAGCGVIEYLNQLKIDKAKAFIREEQYNLTEIAELLGYSSVHYFSRHFKKMTGMTPSEYGKMLSQGYSRHLPG